MSPASLAAPPEGQAAGRLTGPLNGSRSNRNSSWKSVMTMSPSTGFATVPNSSDSGRTSRRANVRWNNFRNPLLPPREEGSVKRVMTKRHIASILSEIAFYLRLKGANPYKSAAYARAARALLLSPHDVHDLSHGTTLTDISGIGPSTA